MIGDFLFRNLFKILTLNIEHNIYSGWGLKRYVISLALQFFEMIFLSRNQNYFRKRRQQKISRYTAC